jgi:esterase/lipase superfamily enzyme
MEYLIFGSAGQPYLLFPTSMGRFYQYEDFSLVQALAEKIHQNRIQLFCVDSVDAESWYNKAVSPPARAARHHQYEAYILSEFLPFIRSRNRSPLAVAGCSFGAYHTANIAFRHPQQFSRAIAISGKYDLHNLADGYFDQDFYFNSPLDFLPNLNDPFYLDPMRALDLVLLSGDQSDICFYSTLQLARVLSQKGIRHTLDIWPGAVHDWPVWKEMARKHF